MRHFWCCTAAAILGRAGSCTRSDAAGTGTGAFAGTLTHHRTKIFGPCVICSGNDHWIAHPHPCLEAWHLGPLCP
jgi:hypothetical protein